MFKYQSTNLVSFLMLLISISLLLVDANDVYVNKTTTTQEPSSTTIPTGPMVDSDDDTNGDDGAALRKDVQSLETNRTKNQEDNHQFYKPEYIKDPKRAMSFWVDFTQQADTATSTKHKMLSQSYRRAAPLKLTFEFPFYGHPLKNIIVATGGFLYVGEHIHHWLAATQNISPLMANFDLSLSNSSDIHYRDNGTALIVQWQNVQMKDNKPPGNFSFQVNLYKNGDIVFVYKSIPVPITEIPETEHPVKVGISDAFLIDKVSYFIRKKTIFDYHRLNLKDTPHIANQTAIYLKALPTCNQYDTCESCAKAPQNLECVWCPAVKRCSNGFDRKRQEWLSNQCDKIQKSDCSQKSAVATQIPTNTLTGNHLISVDSPPTYSAGRLQPDHTEMRTGTEGNTAFVSLLMFVALTSGLAFWAFYAYKNPHTPSGQLLIRYRPGNWKWQNSETRYTAASIHM